MKDSDLLATIFPPEDAVLLWRYASSLSALRGHTPQMTGFKFQFAIRDYVTHVMKYIPYLTSKITGLSGVTHQYDCIFLKRLAIKGRKDLLFFESKWHAQSILGDRQDVMVFNQKAFDVYYRLRNEGRNVDLFRIFVSSVPLRSDAFRFCLAYGILPIQPYEPGRTLEPIEVAIFELEKVISNNPTERIEERSKLIESLHRFREKIFWGCSSIGTGVMESGDVLFNRYRELVTRKCQEVS